MSKRGRDTGGAVDALVQAIVGLGADSSWPGLPPAMAPESLGRGLGQGVLHGRLPKRTNATQGLEASPLAVEQIEHDGQRSIAELGAILWHAVDGPGEASELAL